LTCCVVSITERVYVAEAHGIRAMYLIKTRRFLINVIAAKYALIVAV